MKIKTDNASLRSKIAIRRWLLEEMGFAQVRVLDTCAGAGLIWTAMREHVTVEQWIRCDIKPRQKGTLKIAALEAVRALPLDRFNVIDIDPYGEPWDAYLSAVKRLRARTAMFVTRGRVVNNVTTHWMREVAALPASWPVPLTPALAEYLDSRMLAETLKYATVLSAASIELPHVVYYALGLEPLAAAARPPALLPPSRRPL